MNQKVALRLVYGVGINDADYVVQKWVTIEVNRNDDHERSSKSEL